MARNVLTILRFFSFSLISDAVLLKKRGVNHRIHASYLFC